MNLFTKLFETQHSTSTDSGVATENTRRKRVLNVGGNNKEIPLPPEYKNWEHVLLDVDPRGNPDIVCDARKLSTLQAETFEAIYCSHNLEHYYRHELPAVLGGFLHVLKEGGFANIRVPDIGMLIRAVARADLDVDDVLYHTTVGPITVSDVIYGYGAQIEQSGEDYFAHKTGFTESFLRKTLAHAGFRYVYTGTCEHQPGEFEIQAIAFKNTIPEYARDMFSLPFPSP